MDIDELTIQQYHESLRHGSITCATLTASYLQRIYEYDDILRSIITISQDVLSEARKLDDDLANQLSLGTLPLLYGVPVVLKDTYCTHNMPTTAGTKALATLSSGDAPVVRRLRQLGALILAKTNLHELSLHGCTVSSIRGQTLNPYDITRNPGGSSGGTAVALAANMALVGCGGDTMNSLRSPASACSVIGFRPTTGRISRTGITSVSMTQDSIGPMARTVADVRILFEAMQGANELEDIDDGTRARRIPSSTLRPSLRAGVLQNYFSDGTTEEGREVDKVLLEAMQIIGDVATFIPLNLPELDVETLISTLDVQKFELQHDMDDFLQSPLVVSPHASLRSISQSGDYDAEAVTDAFYETMKEGIDMQSAEYKRRRQDLESLRHRLARLFSEQDLDVLVFPHQRRLVIKAGPKRQPARNGILASLTGSPSICIPGKRSLYL